MRDYIMDGGRENGKTFAVAHMDEHKAIADKFKEQGEVIKALKRRLDALEGETECKPTDDARFDVTIICREFDKETMKLMRSSGKVLAGICGQDLVDIVETASKNKGVEIRINRIN